MESSVAKVQSFLEHGSIKVSKHAWSPHAQTVRHFNTLSDVSAFKNHLGVLAQMHLPLSSRQETLIQQIWAGIQGSKVLTSTLGFAEPKGHLVMLLRNVVL